MLPSAAVDLLYAKDAGLALGMARDDSRTLVEGHTRDSPSPERPATAIAGVRARHKDPATRQHRRSSRSRHQPLGGIGRRTGPPAVQKGTAMRTQVFVATLVVVLYVALQSAAVLAAAHIWTAGL